MASTSREPFICFQCSFGNLTLLSSSLTPHTPKRRQVRAVCKVLRLSGFQSLRSLKLTVKSNLFSPSPAGVCMNIGTLLVLSGYDKTHLHPANTSLSPFRSISLLPPRPALWVIVCESVPLRSAPRYE